MIYMRAASASCIQKNWRDLKPVPVLA